MSYLFTSESVSEGHPDKIADQISDAILDAMLAQDPDSRVACETFVTTGLVVVGGEVTTKAYVEIPEVVRETIKRIGYTKDDYKFDAESCGVMVTLHSQSPDIAQGVDEGSNKEQGAGDQGMMFGYATTETPEYMPMALAFSHRLVKELADIRKQNPGLMPYLRPDAKAQVTIEYDNNDRPRRVHTVVVSTQHDSFIQPKGEGAAAQAEADRLMLEKIRTDVIEHVVKKVIPAEMLDENTIYHINPTGKFVIGGPHGDAGLTGRKIIVDTYGGKGAHGGGAFSGKDSSKVDRSAAYAARHIAKNLVAAGISEEALVQVAYAIGVAKPVSLNVTTYGKARVDMSDAEISRVVSQLFDMRPKAIVERFGLKNPIFSLTAAYGHMGRNAYTDEVEINRVDVKENGSERHEVRRREKKQLEFFSWEKLDHVEQIKKAFGL
ncbi:methionine adenosyltransferase [Cesiribacter andamanensis]|uniref:S-adenosylmethionine synthase n=1 Tax=Cesiribacter andamanensis AMV16 TaxID=1279009 RepID=M7NPY0_9BACT|nr:methionine adenosyltransferase [Cesiribacter andamanensis]EMR03760.1 S-adenosylmethionine synthase [Cesiribacter andamanensis AMV16]